MVAKERQTVRQDAVHRLDPPRDLDEHLQQLRLRRVQVQMVLEEVVDGQRGEAREALHHVHDRDEHEERSAEGLAKMLHPIEELSGLGEFGGVVARLVLEVLAFVLWGDDVLVDFGSGSRCSSTLSRGKRSEGDAAFSGAMVDELRTGRSSAQRRRDA